MAPRHPTQSLRSSTAMNKTFGGFSGRGRTAPTRSQPPRRSRATRLVASSRFLESRTTSEQGRAQYESRGNDLALRPRAEAPQCLKVYAVLDEPDRAVAKYDIGAAGVIAAKAESSRIRDGAVRVNVAVRNRRIWRDKEVTQRVACQRHDPALAEGRGLALGGCQRTCGGIWAATAASLLRPRASTSSACSV